MAPGKPKLSRWRGVKYCFNYIPPDFKLYFGSIKIDYNVHSCSINSDGEFPSHDIINAPLSNDNTNNVPTTN
jgi:hypothetical protein